jgi:zinc/manganese transport system substrate-binding protein
MAILLTRRQALAAGGFFALARPRLAMAKDKVKAVASFSILGDMAKNVGGDRVDVGVLVGPNGNAHVYAPSPADARKVATAEVVFVNGLGFEGWLNRLVRASGAKAPIKVVSQGIKLRERAEDHADDHHSQADPHAWQAVANATIYAANIGAGLTAADPEGRDVYAANLAAYRARLDALEREVRDIIDRIPAERRRVVTTHNAFGYFQDAYGIEFIAPQGVSTEAEASARDVAAIITLVRKHKVPAVFLENVTDPRLLRRIAQETGVKIGGTLYSDALTDEKGEAPTYIELMRHNVRTLSAALSA